MIRRIVLGATVFAVLVVAILFAALNPGAMAVDVGFFEVRLQKSVALAFAFGVGWLFGLLCLAVVMLRMAMERRRLRSALRLAEAEVSALRSLPVPHAD